MTELIVSGGQSGADLAGNEFAREMGITTAIWTFQKFRPEIKADLDVYNTFDKEFVVNFKGDYVEALRARTQWNVEHSDATSIFFPGGLTPGSRLTRKMCRERGKPYFDFNVALDAPDAFPVEELAAFLRRINPRVLNVAGSRTCDREAVREVLKTVWQVMGA